MVTLNEALRLIVIQFKFSNPTVISPLLKHRLLKMLKAHAPRNGTTMGALAIDTSERCSVIELVRELGAESYELVDVVCEPRAFSETHVVKFVYARSEFVDISSEFIANREELRRELVEIAQSNLWRLTGWLYPFYKDGAETEQKVLVLNLDGRQPLLQPDGAPVLEWPRHLKNKRSRTESDKPEPLKAEYSLHAHGHIVFLMKTL